jgi:hypothetical protein
MHAGKCKAGAYKTKLQISSSFMRISIFLILHKGWGRFEDVGVQSRHVCSVHQHFQESLKLAARRI